ncbi:MAG: 3'-5' exonuclease [Chitinophagales bacterium]|nr:3'-5' exonuclease [Chitinophagales bacterium]
MTNKLLFIDTETGGLNPQLHALLSVGLVVWEDGIIIDEGEFIIQTGKKSVSQSALDVNHIQIEQHNHKALPSKEAFENLIAFIDRHFPDKKPVTLAGHNINFDLRFLKYFFNQHGRLFRSYISHRVIDTSSVLHFLYIAGILPDKIISSDEAFNHFNITVDNRHTALSDARATAELFSKLVETLPKTYEV